MNLDKPVQKICIVGGGTAGWMTAAALVHHKPNCNITLVESESIGTIGVGEATIPHLKQFNDALGINERDFIQATKATFKLGIQFKNWGKIGDSYFHPFGQFGELLNNISFHHFYLSALRQSPQAIAKSLNAYSFAATAAMHNKFCFPNPDLSKISSTYSYAYHLDAGLYAQYLRQYAQQKGVIRIEGKVTEVQQSADGNIKTITLDFAEQLTADLFIDCSGFKGLLIEQSLNTGYQSWRNYLPCDTALTVASQTEQTIPPYSTATAQNAGWQWHIPLRHRTGNGYVYASDYVSEQDAQNTLLSSLKTKACSDLVKIKFTTGIRNKSWNKNCVAIGLSAGFLEPLESTGIYLIQQGIEQLLRHFPSMHMQTSLQDSFNAHMFNECERIRDFLLLHYTATQRTDSQFWLDRQNTQLPDSLKQTMELFNQHAFIAPNPAKIFAEPSWQALYIGQSYPAKQLHPVAQQSNTEQVLAYLKDLQLQIQTDVQLMPNQRQFLYNYLNH